MHFDGQHLVPMKWIFSIKTDGTFKARLVGRGDLMIPWVDFNPKEVYGGNISACGIKLALSLAASYKLLMRGGDLVGAYLGFSLRHLDLAQLWFKEKVADGTCIIEKVDSKENKSDIGTKRVSKHTFDYLTHNLIDRSLR